MLTFDVPSRPSNLAIRECARPRFEGRLDRLGDWLNGLRSAGVRQSGPALLLALENLHRVDISINRRLSILSAIKAPLLKTCAGLPKPNCSASKPLSNPHSVTLELRLYRLMFLNLHQALRQLDRQDGILSNRHYRKREWTIRNLFRFAKRQIRYASLWNTRLPEKTWLDLHELHLYLMSQRLKPVGAAEPSQTDANWIDPELEYRQLLLFGLAARLNASLVRSEAFLDGLESWAAQTQLEDPQRMRGRIKLFLVEIFEDAPPRQQVDPLDTLFRGWVLQAPYSFVHQLESVRYTIASLPNSIRLNS
jgi:hypothetical protein